MNILYISYWEVNDPLTTSTVFPHLEILNSFTNVNQIIFTSAERSGKPVNININLPKLKHIPLFSKNLNVNILNKIIDFISFHNQLKQAISKYSIDIIIARGALAGALAYKIYRVTKIPFFVESFEPHADYMREAGVWGKYDLRYLFQKKWERKQLEYASGIMPVSDNYKRYLTEQGGDSSIIFTISCCVPVDKFRFSEDKRNTIRKLLGISPNQTVGIYVGKFGGLYYDNESFLIFKQVFDNYKKDFKLIILSPDNKDILLNNLKKAGINEKDVFIGFAKHEEVPGYLSASDFAFALYKPSPSAKYLSPVKIGEYWANGLPVLCAGEVGDDSAIIRKDYAGAVFDPNQASIEDAVKKINLLIAHPSTRSRIQNLAEKYRSFKIAINVYLHFYGQTK
jgi:glycosyltransferase involved in cell wall biosynthesis